MATCKVCGSPHKACGPSTASLIADPLYRKPEEATVGLHEYNVNEKGVPTVLLLSDEDAERAGLTKKDRVTAAPSVSAAPAAPEPVVLATDDGETVAPLTAAEVVSLRELLARVAEADEADDEPDEDDEPDDEEADDVDDTAKTPEPPADDEPAEKAARAPRNKQARPAADKASTPEATK